MKKLRHLRLIWLVVGIVLLGAVSGLATTHTVDVSGGADFTSIQDAINIAVPGDTINVAAGTYREYVHISTDNLTIQGAGIDQSVIDLDGLTPYWHYAGVSSSYASRAGVLMSGYGSPDEIVEGITFRGFTVMNAGLNPPGGGAYPEFYDGNGDGLDDVRGIGVHNGKDILIQDCKAVYSGYDGINVGKARGTSLRQSEAVTIDSCIASNNPNIGIVIGSYMGDVFITNNTCSDNGMPHPSDPTREYTGSGIIVSGRGSTKMASGVISGNTISDNGFLGINLKKYVDGIVIENNIVTGHNSDEDGAGIFFYHWGKPQYCTNITVQNNTVTGNIRGIVAYYASNSVILGNTISTDSGAFDPGQAGIKLDYAEGITIQSNLLGTTGGLEGNGIRLSGGSHDNTITGNTIEGADFVAIYVSSGGNNNSVTGNTIDGAVLAAFGIRTIGTGSTFTSNVISGTPWVWYTNYSIQAAVDLAGPGDSVYVAEGTYDGAVINKDVTVQGDSAGGTAINDGVHYGGGHPTLETAFHLNTGADGATIEDFTILNDASQSYYFAVFSRDIDDVTIKDLTIYDTVQGISNWGGTGWSVLDNQIIGTVASGGGGIGIFIGAGGGGGYEVVSNNLVQGNVIGSDASAPDYTCPGIVLALDMRYGWYNPLSTYDVGWNQIIGNIITDSGVLNGVGIEVGVIAETGNNPADVPGILADTLGAIHDTTISENTVAGEDYGIYLYNVVRTDVNRNVIDGNTSHGISMWDGSIDNVFRYNSITGNAYGFYNGTGTLVDAALNWWGDTEGPAGEGAGAGDEVSTDVIFSPWLGTDPDGNPTLPGVQITVPTLIVVAPVGPEPTTANGNTGYLNQAIWGSNELPMIDTIEVRHGTYDASEPITAPVNIASETGSALHTTLNGNMSINGDGVLIGLPLQGFRINGDVTVGAGADAGTSRINWSDLYGYMTNNGTGTFDAQYNYWGTKEPTVIDGRTTGLIDYDPYLPRNADDSYVDVVVLINAGVATSIDLAIDKLWAMDRLGQDVTTFIEYQSVAGAGAFHAPVPMGEIVLGGDAGGGGAVGGSMSGTFTGGEVIVDGFTLTDPITGEPITDAAVTLSLMGPDGDNSLVFWGAAVYDEATGEYVFSIDTTGMTPGTYELTIQADDGQLKTIVIVIEEP